MKIALVTNLYPPYARGGAEIMLTRVVTELLAQGHDVTVVSTRPFSGPRTAFPERNDEGGADVYRFFPLNIYHTLRDAKHPRVVRLFWHVIDMLNPMNAIFVGYVLKRVEPDVVMTHNLKGIGLTIPVAIRLLRIPHMHEVHDLQLVVPSGLILCGNEQASWLIKMGRVLHRTMCRLLFLSPPVVISPSLFLKRFYTRHRVFPKSDIRVMPNPVPKIQNVVRQSRSPGPLRLLFVGQLEPHKGIDFLLESLKHLEVDFQLTVAGEGSRTEAVKRLAAQDKRFTYVGFVSLRHLTRLFGVADALVVPSLCYENSPTVIYESLQAGLPVIAADIGGVAELIEEGRNGFLFRPGDAKDLAETLKTADQAKVELFEASADVRSTVEVHQIERYTSKLIQTARTLIGDTKMPK